jgi:hypothetical protein
MADDLQSLADEVGEIQKSFDGITAAIHTASKSTEGWGNSLKELSDTTKASGQLWLVFGRLLSGSGLWRIQNRIKAISNFLKFQDKRNEARMNAEKEIVERMAQQTKLLLDVEKSMESLADIRKGEATHKQLQAVYDSEHMKYLIEVHGEMKARVIMQERLEEAEDNLLDMRREALNVRIAEHKSMLQNKAIEDGAWKSLVMKSDAQKEFLSLTERQQGVYLDMKSSMEDIRVLEVRRQTATEQIDTYTREIADLENQRTANGELEYRQQRELNKLFNDRKKVKDDLADIEKRARLAEEKRTKSKATLEDEGIGFKKGYATDEMNDAFGMELAGNIETFGSKWEEIKAHWENEAAAIDDQPKWVANLLGLKRALGETMFGEKIDFEEMTKKTGGGMSERLGQILEKLPEVPVITGMAQSAVKFFGKGSEAEDYRKKMKENAVKSAQFAGKFLLAIPLIIMALYMLKQAGIIDIFMGMWESIAFLGGLLKERFLSLQENFTDLIHGLQHFFGVLFGTKDGNMWQAFMGVMKPLLLTFLDLIAIVLLSTVGAVFTLGIGLLISAFKEEVNRHGNDITGWLISLGAVLAKGLLVWKSIQFAMWLPLPPWAKAFAGLLMYVLGNELIKVITTKLDETIDAIKEGGAKAGIGVASGVAGAAIGYRYGGPWGALALGITGLVAPSLIEGAMADGGPINKSGNYLVGERGPEILSLPKGSFVTPNHKVGTTTIINVHVAGRLGASDSEVREMADKVGKIVSQEINRKNSYSIFER